MWWLWDYCPLTPQMFNFQISALYDYHALPHCLYSDEHEPLKAEVLYPLFYLPENQMGNCTNKTRLCVCAETCHVTYIIHLHHSLY